MCEEPAKVRALTQVDLSNPDTLKWVQSQWDQLVITNDWLRSREEALKEEVRKLKLENSSLRNLLQARAS